MQKLRLASILVIFGLFFGATNLLAAEMSQEHTSRSGQFQRIEQPLALKIAITVGGLTLMGAQLWWFLGSKPKSK